MRTFKIYSLSNLQICSTVLLTIVIMLGEYFYFSSFRFILVIQQRDRLLVWGRGQSVALEPLTAGGFV